MNRSILEDAWWKFIRNASQLDQSKVVFSQELTGKDGPRPKPPFIAFTISGGPRVNGFDDLRRTGDKFELQGLRQYTLSVQAFGEECFDLLGDLATSLDDTERAYQLYKDAEVAIVNRGNVVNITALLEAGYESRASLDIIFNSNKKFSTSIVPIERVKIQGTISGAGAGEHTIGPFEAVKP